MAPRCFPFAKGTSAIATFRHALSLDERRVRFGPQVWTNPSLSSSPYDAIFPTDVRERWFVGDTRDCGGGRREPDLDGRPPPQLSDISLRWMLFEAFNHGLKVDRSALFASPVFTDFLPHVDAIGGLRSETAGQVLRKGTESSERLTKDSLAPRHDHLSYSIGSQPRISAWAVGARVARRLETVAFWCLEVLPMHRVVWNPATKKKRWTYACVVLPLGSLGAVLTRGCSPHLGRGRVLAPDAILHESVKIRMNALASDFAPENGVGVRDTIYTPKAVFSGGEALSTAAFGA